MRDIKVGLPLGFTSKHRYLELKNFVLQYPEWKQYLISFDKEGFDELPHIPKSFLIRKGYYSEYIELIDRICEAVAGSNLSQTLLISVTQGFTYNDLIKKGFLTENECYSERFYTLYLTFFNTLNHYRCW